MKKLLCLSLVCFSACFLVSCQFYDFSEFFQEENEEKNEKEEVSSPVSTAFEGKWIEEDAVLHFSEQILNYLSKSVDVSIEYECEVMTYKEYQAFHNSYKNAILCHGRVVEIGNGVLKVGEGDFYTNPSNKTLWLSYEAYPQLIKKENLGLKLQVGIVVQEWHTYRYSINKDGILVFDNGRECIKSDNTLIFDDMMLCSEVALTNMSTR